MPSTGTAGSLHALALEALDSASGEAQFRTLAEAIPQIVWTAEPDGQLDYYNERWYSYTGLTLEQTRGWGWAPVVHPDDLADCVARWTDAFTTGEPYEIEYRFKGVDGSYRWHLGRAVPVRDDTGTITKWFGTCTDIEDHKRVIEGLAKSESRFRAFIHQSPVSTVLFDVQGRPIESNPAFERLWGAPATDAPPGYSVLTDHQLDAAGLLPLVRRAFAGEHVTTPPVRYDSVLIAGSGHVTWTRSTFYPVRDAAGAIEHVVAMQEDVTAQVAAQDAERYANERFRVIIDASPDALALFHPVEVNGEVVDFEWVYANPAARGAADSESSIGSSLLATHPSLKGGEQFGEYVRVLQTGEPFRQEYQYGTPERPEWSAITALRAGNELAVTYTNITARKLADLYLSIANTELERRVSERTEALTAANADLARSNADLEAFAYVASHDLQEPLRMVRSYTQLLKRRYRDQIGSDGVEFIDFAADGAARMHQLIEDLLAYSRVGSSGLQIVSVSSGDMVDRAVANLQALVVDSGALITHSDLPVICADAVLLEQLFQNLIANAVKFRHEDEPRISITARAMHEGWTFSVSDNGIGIDPAYSERIFAMFQRLHTRTEYPGTGIGLALCSRIVARHGGTIWVESSVGRGSTFNFTIPSCKDLQS